MRTLIQTRTTWYNIIQNNTLRATKIRKQNKFWFEEKDKFVKCVNESISGLIQGLSIDSFPTATLSHVSWITVWVGYVLSLQVNNYEI